MALQDLIKQNKQKVVRRGPSGLTEESTEELQSLATKAGLEAPPLLATSAGTIGANADQQKMVGSAAQKKKALSLSLSPDQNLQDVVRTQQARTQQTGQEQAANEKSETLKNLGALGDRVNDFINAQRSKLQQQADTQTEVAVQSADSFQGKSIADIKPLLEQLRANPSDMNLMLQVNQALGYDAKRQLDPNEIDSLYESAVDSISRGTAGNIDDDLNVEDLLTQGQLGYTREQLSELLGIPVDQVGTLSVGQIRDQVSKLADEEFSQTAQLEEKADSNLLGVAERGLARTAARDMSASGVRATEADVASLEEQVASADQVTFGGKSYSVEELLQDETISNIVTEYLNSAPGSETRRLIDEREPALRSFIEKNQTLLSEASQQLQTQATEFRTIQSDNKAASTLGGLLSDDVATALIPQFSQLSASRIDPSQVPVLAVANSLDSNQKQQYAQNINLLSSEFPSAMQEMSQLTADDIRALGLDNPGGKWQNYSRDQRRYQELVSIPDQDINALVSQVFDVGDNYDFDAEVRRNTARGTLGIGGTSDSLSIIDANNDGQVDSVEEIRSRLISAPPSLRSAIDDVSTVKGVQKYTPPGATPEPVHGMDANSAILDFNPQAIQAELYRSMAGAASDGRIDSSELDALLPNSSNPSKLKSKLIQMEYLAKSGNLDGDTRNTLNQYISDTRSRITNDLFNGEEVSQAAPDIRQIARMDSEALGGMTLSLQRGIERLQSALSEKGSGQLYNASDVKAKQRQLEAQLEATRWARAIYLSSHDLRGRSDAEKGYGNDPELRKYVLSTVGNMKDAKKAYSDALRKAGLK